jgi:uncharacterized protein YjeT (DUF2065 family)
MSWQIFLAAIGLVFVFEGILPLASPRTWRWLMQQMFIQSDRALQITGLLSMLIGLIIVCVAHNLS